MDRTKDVVEPRVLVAVAQIFRRTGEHEAANVVVDAARALVRKEAEIARLKLALSALGVFA